MCRYFKIYRIFFLMPLDLYMSYLHQLLISINIITICVRENQQHVSVSVARQLSLVIGFNARLLRVLTFPTNTQIPAYRNIKRN